MRITFTKNYRLYRAGDSIETTPEAANRLVAEGVAAVERKATPRIETADVVPPEATRTATTQTTAAPKWFS